MNTRNAIVIGAAFMACCFSACSGVLTTAGIVLSRTPPQPQQAIPLGPVGPIALGDLHAAMQQEANAALLAQHQAKAARQNQSSAWPVSLIVGGVLAGIMAVAFFGAMTGRLLIGSRPAVTA